MTKKTTYKVVASFIILMTVVIPFQNCSQSQFIGMENLDNLNSNELSSLDSTPVSSGTIIPPVDNTIIASRVCRFNGAVVPEGQSRTAYQNSSVAFGQACVSEERFCLGGELQGSYNFATCSVNAPASCLFNDQTIPHGGSVLAFQNSSVPFGNSCLNISERRVCTNGVLSGSNNFSSCQSGAPASCLFDGRTISHGQSVIAYQNSNAGFGSSCISEQRICSNGSLSGSYNFGQCAVDAAASCSFNGSTIAHGENVTAFATSSVPFGERCQSQVRNCINGVLNGSNQFANCKVNAAASCLFDQKTLAHGQSVIAYASSNVSFNGSCQSQTRTCSNGILSGSNLFASCMVDAPASCLVDGKTVAHGEIINTFASRRVPFGASCVAVPTECQNGRLSSTNTHTSCEVDTPATCMFENSQLVQGSAPVIRFKNNLVPFGSSCQSEKRSCESNGLVSGSFKEKSCEVCKENQVIMNGQCITVPGKPTNLKAQATASGTYILSWEQPTVGLAPFTYTLRYSNSLSTAHKGTIACQTTSQTCTVSPPRGMSYYAISASSYGVEGPYSNETSCISATLSPRSISGSTCNDHHLNVQFSKSNNSKIKVDLFNFSPGWVPGHNCGYTSKNLGELEVVDEASGKVLDIPDLSKSSLEYEIKSSGPGCQDTTALGNWPQTPIKYGSFCPARSAQTPSVTVTLKGKVSYCW